jgi:hypothetical protein
LQELKLMPFLVAILSAAAFGSIVYFFGADVVPDASFCYLVPADPARPLPTGDPCVSQLHLAAAIAAFIGWSGGLLLGARR